MRNQFYRTRRAFVDGVNAVVSYPDGSALGCYKVDDARRKARRAGLPGIWKLKSARRA